MVLLSTGSDDTNCLPIYLPTYLPIDIDLPILKTIETFWNLFGTLETIETYLEHFETYRNLPTCFFSFLPTLMRCLKLLTNMTFSSNETSVRT